MAEPPTTSDSTAVAVDLGQIDLQEPTQHSFRADSLALGMVVMLAMTVVQRGVGFLRGIWFCRILDDVVVGQWAMAFGFISLMTPVLLLGIPGSLGRYVEHFRARGHLTQFLRRIAWTTGLLAVAGFACIMIAPDTFGWLIFLKPHDPSLIYAVGVAVLAMVFFNFINDLNGSLRQVRIVSVMQFLQGVGFTIGGVAWLSLGGGMTGLVLTFAVTTMLATAPGIWCLLRGWSGLPTNTAPFDSSGMWRRILPYAAALWAMNVIGNVFELSDRYMILHFTPGGQELGQAAVGQYHSGRIIPVLFLSLATMLGGVLLPYLAADWEAGKPEAVRQRLKQVLFGMSAAFTVVAAITLAVAPWLFDALLKGRYEDGLSLMPMAFVFCTWAALMTVGQDYLWVAEKGKLVAVALAVGLVINVILNAWLIPIRGLPGAVTATMMANGIAMFAVWLAMIRSGFKVDQTALYAGLLPATLLAGSTVAILSVSITVIASDQSRAWLGEVASQLKLSWASMRHRRLGRE